jgi:hypothetical protein
MPPLVYLNAKYTHTGITVFKSFENCNYKHHKNSLANLLHSSVYTNETLRYFISEFNTTASDAQRSHIVDQAIISLSDADYVLFLQETRQFRKLNNTQSRKCKSACNKLTYYTQTRHFKSKKGRAYKMRVGFLTLTSPEGTTNQQFLKAFDHFLDYLRRTANCHFVWKKEIGEKNSKLHVHILVNNFVPYYIINWKWKRLLLAEGVIWPVNSYGKETSAHSRIELPRSGRQIGSYIAKYMSKGYELPKACGYISGHSAILDQLKEVIEDEGEYPGDEILKLIDLCHVYHDNFITHVRVNLLTCGKIAPRLQAVFEEQYLRFSEALTLPQKFNFIEK